MNCIHCGKPVHEYYSTLMSMDGDFACNSCVGAYKRAKDTFYNEVLPDDDKFKQWLKGDN
jgi:NAD-dependent SIR2 family protein deacetylase